MTFRELYEQLSTFVRERPDHEALDQHVVVRLQTDEAGGDDLHCGGLRRLAVDAGCTDTFALVLDANQEPDEPDDGRAGRRWMREMRLPRPKMGWGMPGMWVAIGGSRAVRPEPDRLPLSVLRR